jgi:hypothetical protein
MYVREFVWYDVDRPKQQMNSGFPGTLPGRFHISSSTSLELTFHYPGARDNRSRSLIGYRCTNEKPYADMLVIALHVLDRQSLLNFNRCQSIHWHNRLAFPTQLNYNVLPNYVLN